MTEQAPRGVHRWGWSLHAGDQLWHQRLVLGRMVRAQVNRHFVICTPDLDVYEEDHGLQDGFLQAARYCTDRRTHPLASVARRCTASAQSCQTKT